MTEHAPRPLIAPHVWYYGAVAISVALVAASVLNVIGPTSGPAKWLLSKLNLGSENNVGAWWSGMLLATVSLHAFDGCTRCRQHASDAARGWALIASVLLFFSFDEVGSIHERLGIVGRALGLGTWALLLPLGAVLAAVALRGLVLLWRTESERSKVWPIFVGFCILASVAPQEFLEHRIEWTTAGIRAARLAVEEGSELLGMLVLLRVAMHNTPGLSIRGSDIDQRVAFAVLREWRGPLVGLGLGLAPILAIATAALPDQQRGHPADWLAAVAFLAVALVICSRFLVAGGRVDKRLWAVAGLCLIASIASVDISPERFVTVGPAEVSLRMLMLTGIAYGICATWVLRGEQRPHFMRLGLVALVTVTALVVRELTLVYMLSGLLGIAVYDIHTRSLSARHGR